MKKTQQTKGFKGMNIVKIGSRMRLMLFISLFAVVGIFFLIKSFAATGQIYLSPSTASAQVNQEFGVSIRINPGTPVDVVEKVILTYDAAKLQYVSVNTTGSPFEADLGQVIGTGSIELNRATFGASISADSLIAVVTFKALAGSGNTSMQVVGNAAGSGGYTDPLGGTATVAFTSPPVVTNGVISGVVTSNAGSPIAGAAVNFTVNGAKRSIKTDSAGNYTISNIPAGTYSIKYSARKHQTQTVSVVVTAGTVTNKDVVLLQR